MNERFASVWHALPDGLRDVMQTDSEVEAALFDAASTLAGQKGFTLVRTVNGYRLTGHGRTIHTGQLVDAAKVMRKSTKSTCEPLSGAGGTVTPASTENATKAIYWAFPIAISNWTDEAENATPACCIESAGSSNE